MVVCVLVNLCLRADRGDRYQKKHEPNCGSREQFPFNCPCSHASPLSLRQEPRSRVHPFISTHSKREHTEKSRSDRKQLDELFFRLGLAPYSEFIGQRCSRISLRCSPNSRHNPLRCNSEFQCFFPALKTGSLDSQRAQSSASARPPHSGCAVFPLNLND